MFYDDRSMDAGKGLGVWGAWSVEKVGILSQGMGYGPSGGYRTQPPPLPLKYGEYVDLDPNALQWSLYECFEGIGVVGCVIHREGRYFPSVWDWTPVVDYALIPPSHHNFLVGVAVYLEPQFKYINYSLFTLSIPICRLHAQPSIHAALIFSLVLFVFVFLKC